MVGPTFDKQTFSQYSVEKKRKKKVDNPNYANWVVTTRALTLIDVMTIVIMHE